MTMNENTPGRISVQIWAFLFIMVLAIWIQQTLLTDPDRTRAFMQNQGMHAEGIGTALFISEKIFFLNYLVTPFVSFLKISLVAVSLQLLLLLQKKKIAFRTLFVPVMIAEYAVIAKYFCRQFMIYHIPAEELSLYSMHSIPFSLQSFLVSADYPTFVWQLLGIPSLFALAWLLILSWFLKKMGVGRISDMLLTSLGLWTLSFAGRWALLNLMEVIK